MLEEEFDAFVDVRRGEGLRAVIFRTRDDDAVDDVVLVGLPTSLRDPTDEVS